MPITINAQRLIGRLERLLAKMENLRPEILPELAQDAVTRIEEELAIVDTSSQVGFSKERFIELLRETIKESPDISSIDVSVAGTLADLEAISGQRVTINSFPRGKQNSSLWHEHKFRVEAFKRLVFDNTSARNEIAQARAEAWAGKMPQWIFIEFGGTEGLNPHTPASHFLERATATGREAIKARIRKFLSD